MLIKAKNQLTTINAGNGSELGRFLDVIKPNLYEGNRTKRKNYGDNAISKQELFRT